MVMDLEDGEDVVVEEALLGHHTSHKKPLLGIITKSHYRALRWTLYTSKKGTSYQKEVRRMTEASWSNLHPGRLPANFSQSEATFLFAL